MRLTGRLEKAAELLSPFSRIADIGCDHGKLSAALAARPETVRVIAADISPESLQKARELAERRGLTDKIECRQGNGLTVLSQGECEAAAILGMGGEVIASILGDAAAVAEGLSCLVLQPMSGVEELRQYLYTHAYAYLADCVIQEGGRLYQLFSVKKAAAQEPWPADFPAGCFSVGYRAFTDRDPLLPPLCRRLLHVREKQLPVAAGSPGEVKLAAECAMLQQIITKTE